MRNKIQTAFVLAAGYGKRLNPLTDILPKPLLPIGDSSPLLMIFDKLAKCGIKRIIVNTHHLPEKFDEAFAQFSTDGKIIYKGVEIIKIFEDKILDTGGGIKNAFDLLKDDEAFLVHNADIISNINLKKFTDEAKSILADGNIGAVICLREKGAIKNVGVNGNFVCDMRSTTNIPAEKMMQYMGIFVANKKFLLAAKNFQSDVFSTVDVFLKLIKENNKSVRTYSCNNVFWSDIGTLKEYLKAHKHKDDIFAILAKLADFGFIAKNFSRIKKGASTRHFLRFTDEDGKKLVACFFGKNKREDFLYGTIAKFLSKNKIPVPEILKACNRRRIIVMQDVGSTDLLESASDDIDKSGYYYGLAIESARKLHTIATDAFTKAPFELSAPFDENLYNWEQDYFKQETLKGKFALEASVELECELADIKQKLLKQKQVLLLRDFQSQNVMIDDGKISLIDFQGMRFGCAMYDIASLLFDPYIWLPEHLIDDLLKLYFRGKPDSGQLDIFYTAACQRLLQALGAYGFLSIKCNKPEYTNHFESALKRLEFCAEKANYCILANTARECLSLL